MLSEEEKTGLEKELDFKAISSSGAGGQHVNKTSSKVELTFDVENSQVLDDDKKNLIVENLSSRITNDGNLILQCGDTRSQHKNKSLVIERFFEIINEDLEITEERIPTKVPKAVKKKRLKNKRIKSEKKANRKPPEIP